MKRRLNPALVNRTPASGRLVNWVILGEPQHPILGPERGIGPTEIEEVLEEEAERTAFGRQLRETMAGLSARLGRRQSWSSLKTASGSRDSCVSLFIRTSLLPAQLPNALMYDLDPPFAVA